MIYLMIIVMVVVGAVVILSFFDKPIRIEFKKIMIVEQTVTPINSIDLDDEVKKANDKTLDNVDAVIAALNDIMLGSEGVNPNG